ncbi:MAG TPA: Ig-like domain repeat protein, partial [Chthoniobacterales bacterium]|nr:Ig-like domain repeat protein [Chthoniobacterales bacterium]
NNPSPAESGEFGSSVAISSNRVAVGARFDDAGANDAGSVYLYDLSSATAVVRSSALNNPEPAASDHFGYSVAISDTGMVVGVPRDDTGATDAGSAYAYDFRSATRTTLNNPGPAAGDQFGSSVAISGLRAVVGAPLDDTGANNSGSAYVYDVSGGKPAVPVATLNNPGPAATDEFGFSVAISGTRVVVGAHFDDAGATDAGSGYVYDLSSGTPTVPLATLNNPGLESGDFFGISVAVSGTRVVVGARSDDTGAVNAGSVYVYDLSSPTPTVPVVTLNNPQPSHGADFGHSVAISGTRVLVGAPAAQAAYLYELSSRNPAVPVATLKAAEDNGNGLGWSVAVEGKYAVVCASGSGSTYAFLLAGEPVQAFRARLFTGNDFTQREDACQSVAISGTKVVVGAPSSRRVSSTGRVYIYDLADQLSPEHPKATLDNPVQASDGRFGSSVAISGSRIVVGASVDDTGATDAGRAYVYDVSGGVPIATLNNPSPAANDQFGFSVAISGTRVVVGSYLDDTPATDAGSAYVYDLSSGTATMPVATLNNPAPAAVGTVDGFGYSVAIDGIRVALGAPGDDSAQRDAGAAYVFTPAPALSTQASASVSFGQSVADSATLFGGSAPTGSIAFNLYGPENATCGGSPVFTSTVPVNGNGVYFSTSFTPGAAGTYRWIASYSGDINNAPVSGACNDANQTTVVTPAATSTAVSSSSNPSAAGQLVTFTATATSGAGTPNGTVQFRVDGVNAGNPVALSASGTATYSTSLLSAGNHTISAQYTGSGNFSTSSGTLPGGQQVIAGPTPAPTATVTPSPSPNPSATPSPTPVAAPTPRQLLNIATRLRVQTGENVLIGGLIVTGNERKKVIIRATGPSLSEVFDGALQDTTLALYQGDTLLAENDNWKDSQRQEIEETTIPPSHDGESAIVYTLDPGSYTAVMSGKDGATGIGVIEVYDLDQSADSTLANIASRGFVEAGENVMIGGLIVGGNGTSDARILLRAIGPSLGFAGVAGALADPVMELRDANGEVVRENDNWEDTQPAEIVATTVPPNHPAESAIVIDLPSGNYTAVVRGKDGASGVGLVEVYGIQ